MKCTTFSIFAQTITILTELKDHHPRKIFLKKHTGKYHNDNGKTRREIDQWDIIDW